MELFKFIINYILIIMVLYGGYTLIVSYLKYTKFIENTRKMYSESYDISNKSGLLDICQLNGCVCKQTLTCTYDDFVNHIESTVRRYGKIHVISMSKNIFFNILENNLISSNYIIIRGVGLIPASFIDFFNIVSYIAKTDNIVYHINNGKKYSDSPDELYETYMNTLLELQKMEEFKDVKDVIAIKYSPEFGDRKLIWRNSDTNILYMHGYENDPISMLAAIMFHYKSKISRKDIIRKINDIIDEFQEKTKLSFCMFVENNPDRIVDDIINASTTTNLNNNDIKSVEDSWTHSMFASSIWNYHKYTSKLMTSINSKN